MKGIDEEKIITEARKASEKAISRPVTKGWKRREGAHNDLLEAKGFAISYNPNDFIREYDRLMGMLGSGMDSANPETALIIKDGKGKGKNRYLILRGDHRKEYEKLLPKGKKACIAYFKEKSGELMHFWSDSLA